MQNEKPQASAPVFGGLLPEQIDVLKHPIHINDVAVHPHHNWPYVKGTTVINALNRIFGFAGWSTRNMQVQVVDKSVGKDKDGNTQFRSTILVTLELAIHTPGGFTFVRSGVGADEKASKNFIDTVDNSAASAVTFAIRNAAITLGHQFGLAVQRMKLKDENGRAIDWRRLCSDKRPKMPDLVLLSQILSGNCVTPDGRRFDPSTGVVDDAPDTNAALGEDDERSQHDDDDAGGHTAVEPEQRREPESPPAETKPAAREKVDGQANASGKDAPERKIAEGPPASTEDRRKKCIADIRGLWQKVGKDDGRKIWDEVCRANNRTDLLPVSIAKPAAEGGPADELLAALRRAFVEKAQKEST